jgi:hypothetical protein|tara:strand:+ start:46 stop:453 length:408 start_codon:yes stop_codon:yes gene_type:complete
MATYTSGPVDGNQSFKPFPDGNLGVRYAKFTATTAIAVNDVIQMVDVFAGETVHNVVIKTGDLDTGTALVLDVGDGSDTDYYIDGSTIGQAGGTDTLDANTAPKTYTADDTIDVLAQVGPGGGGTGDIEIWVTVS